MTITFYDIPAAVPGQIWNPNTGKTRYTLDFKGIPYTTQWVEYPEIEPLCKKLGIPPTSQKADGSPAYSLPAIHDSSTGVYISESFRIAEYLEKTYPDTPTVFPHNSAGLQSLFQGAFSTSLGSLWAFILPAVNSNLNPASIPYFRSTREKIFGVTMEELLPKGDAAVLQWAKVKEGYAEVDSLYAKNGGKGPFLLGETPSWADIVVVSFTRWLRIIWGEDSEQWKDISSWHDGRWLNLVENFKKYEAT